MIPFQILGGEAQVVQVNIFHTINFCLFFPFWSIFSLFMSYWLLYWQIMLKPQEKVIARPGKLALSFLYVPQAI